MCGPEHRVLFRAQNILLLECDVARHSLQGDELRGFWHGIYAIQSLLAQIHFDVVLLVIVY